MVLRFHSWQRSQVMDGATEAGGRLQGKLPLTIDDAADDRGPTQLQANVLFRGPGDVAALKSSAVKHTAPGPSTADAETTKLVHIDFFEPDLPWRYSPKVPVNDSSAAATKNRLLPWIVLLVGTPDEFKVIDGKVQPTGPVVSAFDLKNAYRWAHVHEDAGYFISRLISPRKLAPLSNYTAAVVPAFDANGGFRWAGTTFSGELPAFYSWRFQTGEQGDFETLAAALRVRKKVDLGTAKIRYRRPLGIVDVTLETGGAIMSLKPLPVPKEEDIKKVRLDLNQVSTNLVDEIPLGEIPAPPLRPGIMQLPRYGALWLHDKTDDVQWSKSMNDDPRHRGVAGIGLRMGIVEQEALMTAAVEQAGALQDASARIGFLALGIGMSGRLWERRLPKSAELRLRIFGPVMGRMLAEGGGTVLDRVTAPGNTLERALFSSTAMRLTRNGTARARHAKGGRFDRAAFLSGANKPLPASPDVPPGLPHVDAITKDLGLQPIDQILPGQRFPDGVEALLAKFTGQPARPEIIKEFAGLAGDLLRLDCVRSITGYFPKLFPKPLALERVMLIGALNACRGQGLTGERQEFLGPLLPPPARPTRRRPVNLPPLATAVGSAINPTSSLPPAWVRVIGTIDIKNTKITSLEPLEAPIGLDFPTWTLLKKNDPEWLLPGVGQVEPDTVSALKTNPTFIEAYMVGINTQFLAEMRWRNLPAPRVSTPLRMFWGYFDFLKNKREADIQAIANWPSLPKGAAGADDIGSLSHQATKPGDTTGKQDLIIAFRTALFRRYPSTLVYLVKPPLLGPSGLPLIEPELNNLLLQVPNFKEAPENRAARRFFGPIFQGEIQPDLVFFAFDVDPGDLKQYWLVLDEPPAELRFRSDGILDWDNSSLFAKNTIDHPTRVAISGKELEAMAVNP